VLQQPDLFTAPVCNVSLTLPLSSDVYLLLSLATVQMPARTIWCSGSQQVIGNCWPDALVVSDDPTSCRGNNLSPACDRLTPALTELNVFNC